MSGILRNGTYPQQIIYVHTNFHKETDAPACISTLVSGASHKGIKEKHKYYAGHTISLGFENRVSLSYEQLCDLCE